MATKKSAGKLKRRTSGRRVTTGGDARATFAAEAPPPLPIFTIRGQRVILDADLARIYGVPTSSFNQAVRRNIDRFPEDFAFQLTTSETMNLTSQIVISSSQVIDYKGKYTDYFAGAGRDSCRHGGRRHRPWAFTEHGALMAANILRSERAVQMSLYVVRAFVRQREQLLANAAILKRLAEIDTTLIEHDQTLRTIWTELQPLLAPPSVPPKRRIGFQIKDPQRDAQSI